MLADSPQASEKMLLSRGRTETSTPTTQIHNFSRADSTRKGYAASVRLLRRQRLREVVGPYNVLRTIFCEKRNSCGRCTNILRKRMCGVKRIDSGRIFAAVSIGCYSLLINADSLQVRESRRVSAIFASSASFLPILFWQDRKEWACGAMTRSADN